MYNSDMRILYAEDEQDLNNIVTQKLIDEGFLVDSCKDGEETIDYLNVADYDIAIVDIMMPKVDGYEVLEYIKNNKEIPVLFLTAKDAVEDRVKGLNLGAIDYLVKPFSLEELVARIRALTRHTYGLKDNILKIDDLSMDLNRHLVKRGDREIELSSKEYQLLEYLMQNEGIVVSREMIEEHIWNFDYEGGTNVVDVYISYLRKKIDTGKEEKLIHTIRGQGYVIRSAHE